MRREFQVRLEKENMKNGLECVWSWLGKGGAGSGMGSGKFNALWWVIWGQSGPKLAMILLMKNINAVEEVGALNSLVAVLPVI